MDLVLKNKKPGANPRLAGRLHSRRTLLCLVFLALACAALFVLWGLNANNWEYNLPRRLTKVAAIAMTGAAVAVSSLIFQTITNNRILTPSVMGLDSLYLFIQTGVVFLFGSRSLSMMTAYGDFTLSCAVMIVFSLLLYRIVFRREQRNIFVMVLAGMVFGSFFGSLSTFMQVLIDPNEFLIVQGKMFASFNNVNTSLLLVSTVIFALCFAYIILHTNQLDVLALGRENAISLGVNFDRQVLVYLVIVSLLVSVSTALVGPVTFLGVLVVNLSRHLLRSYRHWVLGVGSCLFSVVALLAGQFLVERVFHLSTSISVIINFVGGIYFIFLLMKER